MTQRSDRSTQRPRQTMTDEQINGYLRNLLRDYNSRNTKATDRHIRGPAGYIGAGWE